MQENPGMVCVCVPFKEKFKIKNIAEQSQGGGFSVTADIERKKFEKLISFIKIIKDNKRKTLI